MNGLDLARVKDAAQRFDGARLIVLFGSLAREDVAPWSDADIGVAGVDFWRGLEIGAAIAKELGREPHAVDLDTASDWLRFRVAREGILLAESEADAWVRFQARAALAWFDLQPIVARCAEGARLRLQRGDP